MTVSTPNDDEKNHVLGEILSVLQPREATLNAPIKNYCKALNIPKGKAMKPLTIIYWSKVLFGLAAGLLTAFLSGGTGNFSVGLNLFNAISIAIILYIISYYVYKRLFLAQVGKPTKILSTGVGAYFFTWIVTFALIFTLFIPVLTVTSPVANASFKAGDSVFISAHIGNQLGNAFSGANVTAISPTNATLKLLPSETNAGTYTYTYIVNASDPIGDWKIVITASIDNSYQTSVTVTVHIVNATS